MLFFFFFNEYKFLFLPRFLRPDLQSTVPPPQPPGGTLQAAASLRGPPGAGLVRAPAGGRLPSRPLSSCGLTPQWSEPGLRPL